MKKVMRYAAKLLITITVVQNVERAEQLFDLIENHNKSNDKQKL